MNDPIELDVVSRWAMYQPTSIALEDADTGRSWTWPALKDAVLRLAGFLDAEGVRAGDRVAVLAGNELDDVPLFLATQRLGAILVPVNFRLAAREVEHIVSDCEPTLLFFQAAYEKALTGVTVKRLPFERIAEVMADASQRRFEGFRGRFEDTCMVLYTSGTTGAAKGALISHEMIFWNSISTGLRLDLTQRDVTVSFLPMFHTSGWHVLNTPFLHRGARLVFTRKFEPERILRLCDERGVTVLFGVPTTLDLMAHHPAFSEVTLKTVRFAIVGGEPMPLELIRTWQARGVAIRQGFGLTEFGPNVFSLAEADSERKMGSIGLPNFYVDVKVVAEDGSEILDERVGELALRGPACTKGYWRNETATREAIRDGWFFTGDLVRRDADGFFFVAGRKKDMFISGGENVYPAEVERVLSKHPKVREVAVLGVPDAKWGEVGKAFIAPVEGQTLTLEELSAFCDGQLARYKIPRHLELREELPKGDSGKILKRALKA